MSESPENLIIKELLSRKKSVAWLADLVHISPRHLYFVLTGKGMEKRKLSDGLKKRIEEVLGREFPSPPPSGGQTDPPETAGT